MQTKIKNCMRLVQAVAFVSVSMMLVPYCAQSAWVPSDNHEVEVDGITYKVMLDGANDTIVCLGTNNTQAVGLDSWTGTRPMANCTVEDLEGLLTIPETLTVDGNVLNVTAIAARGFWGQTGLTGVIFPHNFTTFQYGRTFKDCTGLKALWFKGPATVAYGNQTYTTIAPNSNNVGRKIFQGCTALKHVIVGPNAKLNITGTNLALSFEEQTGCTFFLPSNSLNTTWRDFKTMALSGSYIAGTNPNVLYYGPEQELDIEGADGSGSGTITFKPNTAHALTNVLSAASAIHANLGLNVKISITNAIEVAEGSLTNEMFTDIECGSLMFAVKTQAQMDMVLAAVPVTMPIMIDPEGATENLTVQTAGRNIYIHLPKDGTYKIKNNGTMIIIF